MLTVAAAATDWPAESTAPGPGLPCPRACRLRLTSDAARSIGAWWIVGTKGGLLLNWRSGGADRHVRSLSTDGNDPPVVLGRGCCLRERERSHSVLPARGRRTPRRASLPVRPAGGSADHWRALKGARRLFERRNLLQLQAPEAVSGCALPGRIPPDSPHRHPFSRLACVDTLIHAELQWQTR